MRLMSVKTDDSDEIDSYLFSLIVFFGLLVLLYVYHKNYQGYLDSVQMHNLLKCIEIQNFEIILS